MSYNFRLIKANRLEDEYLLRSMHKLRKKVFYDELHWTVGFHIIEDMEFDEYDTDGTIYIVRVNEINEVDATCRLVSTTQPYMLKEHYSHFFEDRQAPHASNVWELSRFCASTEARKSSNGKVAGQIVAAAIEYGLKHKIDNYIALATDTVLPVIKRVVGWDPRPLGSRKKTPDDFAFAVQYTVSYAMLRKIRTKNLIDHSLLSFCEADSQDNIMSLAEAA